VPKPRKQSQSQQRASLRFVEMANPHSWLLAADNLHEQAMHMGASQGRSKLTLVDYRTGQSTSWDGANRSMFLLGGFALENAIKAFLIYENPQWISNGRLSRRLQSHTALRNESRLIPYRNRYGGVLAAYEEGLDTWARYPCGLTAETTRLEAVMNARIWAGYGLLMEVYGRRLVELLTSGVWYGPHGFEGRWTF
jgi:hypothetical protein